MRSRVLSIRGVGYIAIFAFALALSGCGKRVEPSADSAAKTPLLVSAEDLVILHSNALTSGPSITGSVQPERRADLRAEVSAMVVAVHKENGEIVRRGDLLMRLDDTAIRDTLTAAEAAARAADQAFEQAERQWQRMKTLRETGVVSAQQVEDAEVKRNGARSDREAAKTRVVSARQQLQRTEVRAPFDGVVSDRKASAGDTAQIGKELVKVIDPRSLRFEGLVSADYIGDVKTGQQVVFRVHGFSDQAFLGKVTRVNPAVNATTRQVEVLVNFVDAKQQPNVAGLYAEGRIETHQQAALTIPPTALVREGDQTFVWRLKERTLEKAQLTIGERDARTGEYALLDGLIEGDSVLRYPTAALHDGQPIEVAAGTNATPILAETAALAANK